MNTTKNTNEVLSNVYMSNNYAAPISNDELNEFKKIMGYCDATTVIDLSTNFATIVKLLVKQNEEFKKTNDELVENMQAFLQDRSEDLSKSMDRLTDSVNLLRQSAAENAEKSNARFEAATKEMSSGYTNIVRAINFNGSEQRKMVKLDKDGFKFNNTATVEECTHFLNDLNKAARMLANKRGTTIQEVLNSIYNKIKESGEDIYASHSLYKIIKDNNNVKIATMCSNSDYYRNLLEQYITKELRRDFPELYSLNGMLSQHIDSLVLMSHPKKVADLIDAYARKNNFTSTGAAISAYKKLGKYLHRNIKEAAKTYARTLGYKNCSTSYYIASNKECMEALKKIVAGEI